MKKYAKEFRLSAAEQRSPEWYKERAGLPSASGLGFLFDTLRDGFTPSSKAKKYLRQLAYEQQFGVTYEHFVNKPMVDGIFYEDFAKAVYKKDTGNAVIEATSYVSDWFIATPDGFVLEYTKVEGSEPDLKATKRNLLECKVVGDATFMGLIDDGIPIAHELQIQGQLMASGSDWCDYIVVNLKTKSYFIKRIERNNVLIKRIYERLHEPLDLPEVDNSVVKQFDGDLLKEYMGDTPMPSEDVIIEDLGF